MARAANGTNTLLATGGGNATAGGVTIQASIAASMAVQAIAALPLDSRLELGAAKPVALRLETEAPVDDVLVQTDASGWLFVQSKNSLNLGSTLTSELGKTCDEFARLWLLAGVGAGNRGWDRPLVAGRDAMLIAVGPTTAATVRVELPRSLNALRMGSTATLTAEQNRVLAAFKKLLGEAFSARSAPATINLDDVLKFIHVLDFDFGGPHRDAAQANLANAIENSAMAPAAFAAVERKCQELMATRGGIDAAGLRTALAAAGTAVKAPPEFRADVDALRHYAEGVSGALRDFQRTQVAGTDVTVNRECTHAVVAAATAGSLVIVGDPGSGKSAVVTQAAHLLRDDGNEVVLLAVDRLQVETVEGLSGELGIAHSLVRVLANWPGSGPAYLFLDALDACRFGRSEALFRSLIQQVLNLGGRWRVVASIRTFDLAVGREFGRLFRGVPPAPGFVDPRFQNVCHIQVSDWSDAEFDDLLTRIPALRTAVENGGPKLAELARVPFNTRLLAELLSDGVAPEALENLGSQVQLLEMYWAERVQSLGAPAEQCLRTTLQSMVNRGRLEAPSIDAAAGTGDALDNLRRQGVLISLDGNRQVAFRHHILFDYAASRLLINLEDLPAMSALLGNAGSGLLLAPAFSFALQHLWESAGADRMRFWSAAVYLIGDADADPVARSVAARAACDFPTTVGDMAGLLALMNGSNADVAANAFKHIVGSLSVRLEDDLSVPAAPWCFIAAEVAGSIDKVAWPLRQLIGNFIDRVDDPGLHSQLGLASRALMNYAFDAPGGEHLMPLALGHVGKTFATDSAASRALVLRLLQPQRMEAQAHNDMHWLSQEIGRISAVDPTLCIQIYERVFTHRVTDDSQTDMGGSRILRLTSNRRQDYPMAEWGLKEAFPAFAQDHPLEAADAAIAVAWAYANGEHGGTEEKQEWSLTVGDMTVTLREDHSHIWASEFRRQHEDDAQQVVDALIDVVMSGAEAAAAVIANRIVEKNKLAWMWARLFMAAAHRGGTLAAQLWPIAAREEFLTSGDTTKDAIDLVAADYANRSAEERRALEEVVLGWDFPKARDPAALKRHFERKIFGSIERTLLVSEEAGAVVDGAAAEDEAVPNERPFRIRVMRGEQRERDKYGWLREEGVDIDAAENSGLLPLIEACDRPKSEIDTIQTVLTDVEALRTALDTSATAASPKLLAYGWERLTHALADATDLKKTVVALTDTEKTSIHTSIEAAMAANPVEPAERRYSFLNDARAHTVRAILNTVRIDEETAKRYEPAVDALLDHKHEGVRSEIADRIGFFWIHDRAFAWHLAERLAAEETNPRVLVPLLNFLIQAINEDPQKVSGITQALLQRTDIDEEKPYKVFSEGLGTLIFYLWIAYGDAPSRATLDVWLSNRKEHKVEISHGVFSIRDDLVLYDSTDAFKERIRRGSQALAHEIVDLTAQGVLDYYALPNEERVAERQERASADAELLDRTADQFLFAVGASELRQDAPPKALADLGQRRRYLADSEATFRRIGEAATPHAIYYLLQLLDFLMPADPAKVFDLVAHCLLGAGKLHNYQTDSLGVDQFVTMIEAALADHREMFDDRARRMRLVEVLEVFVNAGWPKARRLLYRLPEALR